MIVTRNSYLIDIPAREAAHRVMAIVKAIKGAGHVCHEWSSGHIVIVCTDDKFQKRLMRRLQAASREDFLEETLEG